MMNPNESTWDTPAGRVIGPPPGARPHAGSAGPSLADLRRRARAADARWMIGAGAAAAALACIAVACACAARR
jgi:hypothetical protein